MVIDDVNIKLPRKEESIKKFYENCEKRKKFISSNEKFAEAHLKKARHDLYRGIKEFEDSCWDWTVIKTYYSIHHSANYILLKKKKMICKDHSCLIIALQYYDLVPENIFNELSKLHESLSDALGLDLTFQLRKIGQYDVEEWENISEKDAKLTVDIAKKMVEIAENV